jgi:hypothetical protein
MTVRVQMKCLTSVMLHRFIASYDLLILDNGSGQC